MEYFPWKDEYSVGIFEIDSQHRRLIAILNRLYSEMWEENVNENIDTAITELMDYTMTHFKFEEALMDRYGYPKAAEHKAVHSKLTQEVYAYKSVIDKNRPVNPLEVIPFLKEWLSHHILQQDKAYVSHLLQNMD
jgi:hemerythrin